ncbi:isochorismatase family protein [Streptomyces sp. JHA26]|uniref:isochorismatase family protein n=1 Tax=Streptomyces sp. JHA26 TaxID=1917143 RepID=UPI00098BA0DD|nr:isochorismatase family protein [Streptomyces sp. JHA26]
MARSAIPEIRPYSPPTADDLPRNTANWTVDPDRALLLIHDMQHYFLGFLPDGEPPRRQLEDQVTALRRAAARAGVPVVYTAQPGDMTEEQRGLLKDFWGPGMTGAPEHRGIPERFGPADADTVLTKWRPSAFFRTGLLELLRTRGRDQLVLCGVYAHVGILQTAMEALANDVQAFLVADAVADFSAADHHMALSYAAARCAMVVPAESVLSAFAAAPAGATR